MFQKDFAPNLLVGDVRVNSEPDEYENHSNFHDTVVDLVAVNFFIE